MIVLVFTVILAACIVVTAVISFRAGYDTALNDAEDASMSCEACNSPLNLNKESVYVTRDNSFLPQIYDAVDCPVCGKQHILGRRMRRDTYAN